MKKLILFFFKILHINISEEKVEALAQFAGFALVGVSNTFISFFVFAILLKLFLFFNSGNNYIYANIIAFFVSVTNSFVWNNLLVFKKAEDEKRSLPLTYIKTVLSYAGTGLLLSNVLLFLAVDNLGMNKFIANFLIVLITIPINFVVNKFWAYKSDKK